jgi:hypothetical protein
MQIANLHFKDLLIIFPASLALGAGLSALQAGAWWIGLLGFSALFVLGLAGLTAAWRRAGAGKTLAWMIALALILRLAAGVAVYIALPLNGHSTADDQAGYVFTDAHRRDDQAWGLATSGKPLWSAFDRSYYTDQYGGLLAFSALTYRYLSPDAHRPLLIIVLASLTAALGVPFLFQAVRLLWNEQIALAAGWLFVLYPESILTGGAQMREPFLLTFSAMALWGFADWLKQGARRGWAWIGAGLAGMLLVSPAIALVMLIFLAGWLYVRGERQRINWKVWAGLAIVFLAGMFVLSWSLNRNQDFSAGSPLGIILNWFRQAAKWDTYQLERGSGWIQLLFKKMNTTGQLLFVIVYGILQPVLPAAFVEPTTLTWQIISILRAAGWYALLPLLIYAWIAAWRSAPGPDRRLWLWIVGAAWLWILICSIRAGGDQWDNPRYRLILFGLESIAAAFAWTAWRESRDAWLPRLALVELLAVLIFLQWYLSRYYHLGGQIPFYWMIALIVLVAGVILAGGWLWDRRRAVQPA